MRARMSPVWFMTVACLLGLANSSAAQCDPDGNVQFVCGYVNPEDLVAVPRSPWVIVSSSEGLHAADARDHSKAVLFPPRRRSAMLIGGSSNTSRQTSRGRASSSRQIGHPSRTT